MKNAINLYDDRPTFSKCNCEIKNLDLLLTFNCDCNKKENMREKNIGCICKGCKCFLCCTCGYYDYCCLAKRINIDTSSFDFKIFYEKLELRHYCRIKPRSLIGEFRILINKISSKKRKWIYHIFKFTNDFKSNHISDLYNNIYFKQYNIKRDTIINYNNNNYFFDKAKEIIETIINSFFHKNIKIIEKIPTYYSIYIKLKKYI
jgi:hypothetical protein